MSNEHVDFHDLRNRDLSNQYEYSASGRALKLPRRLGNITRIIVGVGIVELPKSPMIGLLDEVLFFL